MKSINTNTKKSLKKSVLRHGKKGSVVLLLLLITTSLFAAPTATVRNNVIKLELAKTKQQQRQGLMFRKSICKKCGMLFIFKEKMRHHFWMKNTSIPLDMIFMKNDGTIIGIIENTKPNTTRSYSIKHPSRYVLEINAHFCKRNSIKPGDKLIFREIL